MDESILTSIKKLLGIVESYEHFDQDIIIHINSAFMILRQLGVGPVKAFTIQDDGATWRDFLGDNYDLESVKTLVYLRVRLIFDPPSSSFAIESINKIIKELEWRLNVECDPVKEGELYE